MNQQEAYRKIEQLIAIFKVLLNAGIINSESLKTDAVSNAVDQLIASKVMAPQYSDTDIIKKFNADLCNGQEAKERN